MSYRLTVLPQRLTVCRLEAADDIPSCATSGPFVSITRTDRELSVVCCERYAPTDVVQEPGWRLLRVDDKLTFADVGVLARLSEPLAAAGVSILAIATYDTDYILVKEAQLATAIFALRRAGHEVVQA